MTQSQSLGGQLWAGAEAHLGSYCLKISSRAYLRWDPFLLSGEKLRQAVRLQMGAGAGGAKWGAAVPEADALPPNLVVAGDRQQPQVWELTAVAPSFKLLLL